jgi:hypothetical protein
LLGACRAPADVFGYRACNQSTQTRRASVDSEFLCTLVQVEVQFSHGLSPWPFRRPDRLEGRGAEGQGRRIQYLGCCTRASPKESFEGSIPLLVGGARLLSSRLRWEPALWQRQRGDGAVRCRHRPICPPVPLNPARGGGARPPPCLLPPHVSREVESYPRRKYDTSTTTTNQPTDQPTCNRRPSRCLSQPLQSLSLSLSRHCHTTTAVWMVQSSPSGGSARRTIRSDRSIESSRVKSIRMPDKPEPGGGVCPGILMLLALGGFQFRDSIPAGGSCSVDGEKRGTRITTTTATFGVARRDGCGGSGQHEHWTWRPVGMRGGERQQREQTKESAGELSISYRRMLVMPTAS